MKVKNIFKFFLIAITPLLIGCKDDETLIPIFESIKVSSYETGTEIEPSNVPVGKQMKYFVKTDADLCVLWPGGKRDIIKSKLDATKDSINIFGDVVLNGNGASDDYRDYGLFGAKGVTTSGSMYTGYSTTYTFSKTGTYKMVIVLSNHGTSNTAYKQIIAEQIIVVK